MCDLEVKKREPQTLPGLVEKVTNFREEVQKVLTATSDFDNVPLQFLEVLQTEVAAVRNQLAEFTSAANSATKRNESVRDDFLQR